MVAAQDLTFSAAVDKTSVAAGDPIHLTLTLSGDIAGSKLPPLQFPKEFAVIARSQSTNFSLRSGAMEQSLSITCVLVPQRSGTFQLGPFTLQHRKQQFQTESIEITVEKSSTPPPQPQGKRFIL
jgi:hypothetical protein